MSVRWNVQFCLLRCKVPFVSNWSFTLSRGRYVLKIISHLFRANLYRVEPLDSGFNRRRRIRYKLGTTNRWRSGRWSNLRLHLTIPRSNWTLNRKWFMPFISKRLLSRSGIRLIYFILTLCWCLLLFNFVAERLLLVVLKVKGLFSSFLDKCISILSVFKVKLGFFIRYSFWTCGRGSNCF
jgi:hypothetical protein